MNPDTAPAIRNGLHRFTFPSVVLNRLHGPAICRVSPLGPATHTCIMCPNLSGLFNTYQHTSGRGPRYGASGGAGSCSDPDCPAMLCPARPNTDQLGHASWASGRSWGTMARIFHALSYISAALRGATQEVGFTVPSSGVTGLSITHSDFGNSTLTLGSSWNEVGYKRSNAKTSISSVFFK